MSGVACLAILISLGHELLHQQGEEEAIKAGACLREAVGTWEEWVKERPEELFSTGI